MLSWTRTKVLDEGTQEGHNKVLQFCTHALLQSFWNRPSQPPEKSESVLRVARAGLPGAGELSVGGEPKKMRWKSSRDKDRDTPAA